MLILYITQASMALHFVHQNQYVVIPLTRVYLQKLIHHAILH